MNDDNIKQRLEVFLKYKHISKSEFGRMIGVSNAFVTSIRKSIQPDKIKSISLNFPDINIEWLLTGNGEMTNDSIEQNIKGDKNISVAGNGNHINASDLSRAINEISAQRKLTEKAQEQIDRLIGIIESQTKK